MMSMIIWIEVVSMKMAIAMRSSRDFNEMRLPGVRNLASWHIQQVMPRKNKAAYDIVSDDILPGDILPGILQIYRSAIDWSVSDLDCRSDTYIININDRNASKSSYTSEIAGPTGKIIGLKMIENILPAPFDFEAVCTIQ